jgi:hypothetical protein
MPFFHIFKLFFCSSVGGLLLWIFAPWPTHTIVFHRENFQCQIPMNWSIKRTPLVVMGATRPTGGSFFIAVHPLKTAFHVDSPTYSAAFRNKLIADGHDIIGDNHDPFEGQTTYTISFSKTINGKLIFSHSINFVANNFVYSLDVSKVGSDPMRDSQLVGALNSFALLSAQ